MSKYFLILISLLFGTVNAQTLVVDTVCYNTPTDDFGIRPFGQELILVSGSKKTSVDEALIDENIAKPYTDLFRVDQCGIKEITLNSKDYKTPVSINSTMHDGPISANQAGTMVFFSNNSYSKKNKLGIFYSSKEGDAWTLPLAFPLNNEGYNVTHPFYDEANKKLYYASDFEKGNSKYDLYYSDYNGKDWSRPIAIQAINSDSIECFPFVYKNKIYFTSNNKLSMGGLDLFVYENDTVKTLGEGFNSIYDDLAIAAITDTSGYFSSNRNSNGKQDDLFSYLYLPPVKVVPIIEIDTIIIAKKEIEQPENVVFGFDQYVIKPSQFAGLDALAEGLLERTELYLVVAGHTDNVGNAAYNLDLSRKRANAVKDYLVLKGVDTGRIIVEYHGLTKPIASNATQQGRDVNRRVDFKLLGEIKN
jgi:outer membrane protein OmpA-like peptidoglycan-associated protein